MARGFGSTFGVSATTDEYRTGLRRVDAKMSLFCSYIKHSSNAGTGHICQIGFGATDPNYLLATNADTTVIFGYAFSTTAGQWTWSLPASSAAWHTMGVTYDNGSLTNLPAAYTDGVAQSVSTNIAPVGTPFVGWSNSILTIGNVIGNTLAFDGVIGDFTVWNCLLLAREFVAMTDGVNPTNIRPYNIVGYWPMMGETKNLAPSAYGNANGLTPFIRGTKMRSPYPKMLYPNPDIFMPPQMLRKTSRLIMNAPMLGM